jgi:hypothetical protein
MTSIETLYRNNVVNELSFLLVTHTTSFDIRFGHYGFLEPCLSSGQTMDRLVDRWLVRLFAIRWVKLVRV